MATIRSLVVKIGADLSGLQRGLNKAQKDFEKFGKQMTKAGDSLTKTITLPAIAAATAITALTLKAGQNADELITMSNKTGIAVKQLQELQYASRFVDVEVETMTDSIFKLTRSMSSAMTGSKDTAAVFKALGVEYKDNVTGGLRDSKKVWLDTIDALGRVASETDRDAASMLLFGRSAQELNPLIRAGRDELQRLAREADRLGIILSDDSVRALGQFDDSMQRFKASLETAGAKVAIAFLPVMDKLVPLLTDKIAPAVEKVVNFISKMIDKFSNLSPEAQKTIGIIAGLAIALGPLLTAIGNASLAIAGLTNLFKLIISPAGLVVVAVAAIGAAAYLIISNWSSVVPYFENMWGVIKNLFNTGINGVLVAIAWMRLEATKIFKLMIGALITSFEAVYKVMAELPGALGEFGRQGMKSVNKIKEATTDWVDDAQRNLDKYKNKLAETAAATSNSWDKMINSAYTASNSMLGSMSKIANVVTGNNGMSPGLPPGMSLGGTPKQETINLDKLFKTLQTGGGKAASQVDKLKDSVKTLVDSIKSQTDAFAKFAGIFDIFERKAISGTRLLNRMRAQVKAMGEWRNALVTLESRGVDKGLLQELRGMGPAAVDNIMALSKMSDAQLKEYSGLFKQRYGIAAKESEKFSAQNYTENITIAKLADSIVVKSEADIDKIANQLVSKLRLAGVRI